MNSSQILILLFSINHVSILKNHLKINTKFMVFHFINLSSITILHWLMHLMRHWISKDLEEYRLQISINLPKIFMLFIRIESSLSLTLRCRKGWKNKIWISFLQTRLEGLLIIGLLIFVAFWMTHKIQTNKYHNKNCNKSDMWDWT